jgi:cyclase
VRVHRTLIVARMSADDSADVAQVFANSDASDLPHVVGVDRRTLFRFHGLYFHLVEAQDDISPNLYKARSHPLYQEVNERLAKFISPFDPGWQEPKDAMAETFYSWSAR